MDKKKKSKGFSIKDKIIELAKTGQDDDEIRDELRREGRETSSGYIEKVKSEARREGVDIPKSRFNPREHKTAPDVAYSSSAKDLRKQIIIDKKIALAVLEEGRLSDVFQDPELVRSPERIMELFQKLEPVRIQNRKIVELRNSGYFDQGVTTVSEAPDCLARTIDALSARLEADQRQVGTLQQEISRLKSTVQQLERDRDDLRANAWKSYSEFKRKDEELRTVLKCRDRFSSLERKYGNSRLQKKLDEIQIIENTSEAVDKSREKLESVNDKISIAREELRDTRGEQQRAEREMQREWRARELEARTAAESVQKQREEFASEIQRKNAQYKQIEAEHDNKMKKITSKYTSIIAERQLGFEELIKCHPGDYASMTRACNSLLNNPSFIAGLLSRLTEDQAIAVFRRLDFPDRFRVSRNLAKTNQLEEEEINEKLEKQYHQELIKMMRPVNSFPFQNLTIGR